MKIKLTWLSLIVATAVTTTQAVSRRGRTALGEAGDLRKLGSLNNDAIIEPPVDPPIAPPVSPPVVPLPLGPPVAPQVASPIAGPMNSPVAAPVAAPAVPTAPVNTPKAPTAPVNATPTAPSAPIKAPSVPVPPISTLDLPSAPLSMAIPPITPQTTDPGILTALFVAAAIGAFLAIVFCIL